MQNQLIENNTNLMFGVLEQKKSMIAALCGFIIDFLLIVIGLMAAGVGPGPLKTMV